MKKIGLSFFMTMLFVLMIPGFISFFFGSDNDYGITEPIAHITRDVPSYYPDNYDYSSEKAEVFNPETESGIGFEDYICGVVAAEMPYEYEAEALKAQAVAARTYAYKRLPNTGGTLKRVTKKDIGGIYQAYLSVEELKELWGDNFESGYQRIMNAVLDTEGIIMVYEGEPVEAVFHSSSAGMTEDAENVWSKEYPYLKSVPSLGDDETSEKRFENDELISLFRNKFPETYISGDSFLSQFEIISRTDAGYVSKARIGKAVLTGMQIREALSLKSSSFTVSEENGTVVFVTKGYGHGVGMSQDGANSMAKEGTGYKEILEHFYTGAVLSRITDL